MKIVNSGKYLKEEQINKILKLYGLKYIPTKIVICDGRKDIFKLLMHLDLISFIFMLLDITIWFGKVEGIYVGSSDSVIIFIFSQNDDGDDVQSKQLYSLHALSHELRHRWQIKSKFVGDEEKDADEFATKFINKNSKKISNIMKWEDEWEVEEEY